ncbi:DNA phosphorothioation-associated putative methyltransferase [Rhodococcus sp. Z13]|uniref:DNA phosphorothioation-associated putative methyltransferase n=1 Tax=Rhodococcus sacchari TaxID=2962047 RepID=A0ACD4DJF8_9NOCA|nr:DNA phosphorothioation-associated putative methyltransferase [Rhodococcus sp. Z13]UYP20199.1 DNA phosphorothioation-associated putative methyltransferase [Rhodococcus sp. Z13]
MTTIGPIARHKTAMVRSALSRPMGLALADGLIARGVTVFDYGCGRGGDIRQLEALGFEALGWDPAHRPDAEKIPSNVVNLGYVVNVIEDPVERVHVLESAWDLTRNVLVVSARLTWEARELAGRRVGDGIVTRLGTFQKFYDQLELAGWIESVLGTKPIAAAPGVFYVFRDEAGQQDFLANRVYRYRPRITVDPHEVYEQNREKLAQLFDFLTAHARPPKQGELSAEAEASALDASGTLGRAVNLIYRVTDDSHWEEVRTQRRSELLVYAAMSRFSGKPRFSQLGPTLQRDIKAHFGTYRELTNQGDRLLAAVGNKMMVLMSARSSKIGKQTPSALYVHRSALAELSPIMQVYEGCARVLAGTVERANMIKFSVTEPQISYLTYPGFDRDAHPVLDSAVTVNLRKLTVDWRDYSKSVNPPLLHRKEEFIGREDRRRDLYERLTAAEVRAGLYAHPEQIGSLKGWERTLRECGCRIRGHRLERVHARHVSRPIR